MSHPTEKELELDKMLHNATSIGLMMSVASNISLARNSIMEHNLVLSKELDLVEEKLCEIANKLIAELEISSKNLLGTSEQLQ